jgi:hypothetical protein
VLLEAPRLSPPAAPPAGIVPVRARRRWLALALALLGLAAVAFLALAPWGGGEDGVLRLAPPEGLRTTGAMTVVVAIDHSGSLVSSDPTNLRRRQTGEVARWLAAHGHLDDRVGVIHFAGGLTELEPTRARFGLDEVERELAAHPPLDPSQNTFRPALEAATAMFDRAPGTTPVLLLVTDGQPDGVEPPTGIARGLRTLPEGTAVHILGLDGGRLWTRNAHHWLDVIPLASVTVVRDRGGRSLADALAATLGAQTGQTISVEVGR